MRSAAEREHSRGLRKGERKSKQRGLAAKESENPLEENWPGSSRGFDDVQAVLIDIAQRFEELDFLFFG